MMTIEQALEIKQNWTFEQAKNDLALHKPADETEFSNYERDDTE